MAPIFTANRMNWGWAPGEVTTPAQSFMMFEHYNATYGPGPSSDPVGSTISNPAIRYLYVIGTAGGGSCGLNFGPDDGTGGGGGGGACIGLTGFEIASGLRGSPITAQVGDGGQSQGIDQDAGNDGGTTQIIIDGNVVFTMSGGEGGESQPTNGGEGGGAGLGPNPGLTYAPGPWSGGGNLRTGGDGGRGGARGGSTTSQSGGAAFCGGGGGGGGHNDPNPIRPGSDGGSSQPSVGPLPYNRQSVTISDVEPNGPGFVGTLQIDIAGESGGPGGGAGGTGGGEVALAKGGNGNPQNASVGGGGGAGAGVQINCSKAGSSDPNLDGNPNNYHFGGGGGGFYAVSNANPPTTNPAPGSGGGGCLVVVGSSYLLSITEVDA